MTTLEIQRRLAALGYDPGPLDGLSGPRTRKAVENFQRTHGLAVDGIVGRQTRAALNAEPAASGVPDLAGAEALPWYEWAESKLGLRERPGPANNPEILEWAADLDISYSGDDVPWCGLFVARAMSLLPDEPLPANELGARNWLRFGVVCKPQRGALLVFWRGSRGGWMGHVGFYAGERADAFKVLGGNQSDSVSYAWIAKNRLLGTRWPATAPFLATGPIRLIGSGPLSENEA